MGNPLAFTTPTPTFAGFQTFIQSTVGIPVTVLPLDSEWYSWAWNWAAATVNENLALIGGPQYLVAVYNLGAHVIVSWAPDVVVPPASAPAPYPTNNPDGTPYFQFLRQQFNIVGFVPGVVNASSDESTSTSLLVPDVFKDMNIDDLALLTTPWGRTYAGLAQKVGSVWGIS